MAASRRPADGQVPVNVLTRLFFGWSLVWIGVSTAICASGYLLCRLVSREPALFSWWTRAWGRLMFFFMGLRISCEGFERIDRSAPCVLAANHQNGLDIPLVALALPMTFSFVAKAELEHAPFLGAALKASPSVFVDPRDPRRSIESLRKAGREIREGTSVLVFPEGARSYDGRMTAFRKGAFQLAFEAQVPMIPVTIVDAVAVFNEKKRAARPGRIRVVVGEPVGLAGLDRRSLPGVMETVRDRVAGPLPPSWRNPPEPVP